MRIPTPCDQIERDAPRQPTKTTGAERTSHEPGLARSNSGRDGIPERFSLKVRKNAVTASTGSPTGSSSKYGSNGSLVSASRLTLDI